MPMKNRLIITLSAVFIALSLAVIPGCSGFKDSVNRQHEKINRSLTNLDRKIQTGVDKTPVGKSNTAQKTTTTMRHKVKYKGETLSIISGWYTGNAANWRTIARRNASVKPNRLSIGATVWIPEKLLVTSKPLPKWYVQKKTAPPKKKTASKLQETPEDPVQETPEDPAQDTPEDPAQDTPEDPVEDTPEDTDEDTPEDTDEEVQPFGPLDYEEDE